MHRRDFLRTACLAAAALTLGESAPAMAVADAGAVLREFGYGDVEFAPGLVRAQFEATLDTLMKVSDDSMLKPFRQRAGLDAPGLELGGWYENYPGYDAEKDPTGRGFAPGHAFGQWISGLARACANTGRRDVQAKVERLVEGYRQTISPKFYTDFRWPSYVYDKLVLGLLDARRWAEHAGALDILQQTTDTALPYLPARALDHDEMRLLPHKDESWCWDESYTLPENLFLAYQQGAGDRYRQLATRFLKDDTYFNPLSEGKNVLPGHHAYSYTNALSSAMQAYLTLGSRKHLKAARNAFAMIASTQSYATGGWGPDESFRVPGKLAPTVAETHSSFETPCGAYAHFKLTRYLLRVTREARYGDSMERVLYNTILGALPLQLDGRAFYYADCNLQASKFYHNNRWPCCAGTLPQIAADYHVSTYLKDDLGVWVNLYLPSSLRYRGVTLRQSGGYPLDGRVLLEVEGEGEFSLRLRIPEFAQGARIRLNDQDHSTPIGGTFASLRRVWRTGDRVELSMPMSMNLNPIDSERVALSRGPLVLFARTHKQPGFSRAQLLGAAQVEPGVWRVGEVEFVPYTTLQEGEPYTTYLTVS